MQQFLARSAGGVLVALVTLLASTATVQAQQTQWKLDPAHTSVYFRASHADISFVYGRFNQVNGQFTLGSNPSFEFTARAASVDTGNEKRDNHLRGPDFFNAKQFPVITFQSTQVNNTEQGYKMTGNLTLHGNTREITVDLRDMGQTELPKGTVRHGFSTEFTLKRSNYGMDNMLNVVGDKVTLMISFEGIKQ
jgi:polyisoprenoid-binding protein YceI